MKTLLGAREAREPAWSTEVMARSPDADMHCLKLMIIGCQ